MASDQAICYIFAAGQTTPNPTPIGRRDIIRDALATGDWETAAEHLATARHRAEWRMVPCISGWCEYVETLGISRQHGWRLVLIAATGQTRVCYTLRQAFTRAVEVATSPPQSEPEPLRYSQEQGRGTTKSADMGIPGQCALDSHEGTDSARPSHDQGTSTGLPVLRSAASSASRARLVAAVRLPTRRDG